MDLHLVATAVIEPPAGLPRGPGVVCQVLLSRKASDGTALICVTPPGRHQHTDIVRAWAWQVLPQGFAGPTTGAIQLEGPEGGPELYGDQNMATATVWPESAPISEHSQAWQYYLPMLPELVGTLDQALRSTPGDA